MVKTRIKYFKACRRSTVNEQATVFFFSVYIQFLGRDFTYPPLKRK